MARKPNYSFERRERERLKAAKKAARLEAKRERAERKKALAAGLLPLDEDAPASLDEGGGETPGGSKDQGA